PPPRSTLLPYTTLFRSTGDRLLDEVEARADPAVVGAAGGPDVDVGRHLRRDLDQARGELGGVADEDERGAHAHAPAADAAVSSSRAELSAPGSRCPAERSPR